MSTLSTLIVPSSFLQRALAAVNAADPKLPTEQTQYLRDIQHELLNDRLYLRDLFAGTQQALLLGTDPTELANFQPRQFIEQMGTAGSGNDVVILGIADDDGNLKTIVYNEAELDPEVSGTIIPAATGLFLQHIIDDESGENPIGIISATAEDARPTLKALLTMMAPSSRIELQVGSNARDAQPRNRLVLDHSEIEAAGPFHHFALHKLVLTPEQQSAFVCNSNVITIDQCDLDGGGTMLVSALLDSTIINKVQFKNEVPIDAAALLRLFRELGTTQIGPKIILTEGAFRSALTKDGVQELLTGQLAAAFTEGRTLSFHELHLDDFGDFSEHKQVVGLLKAAIEQAMMTTSSNGDARAEIVSNLEQGMLPVELQGSEQAKLDLLQRLVQHAKTVAASILEQLPAAAAPCPPQPPSPPRDSGRPPKPQQHRRHHDVDPASDQEAQPVLDRRGSGYPNGYRSVETRGQASLPWGELNPTS